MTTHDEFWKWYDECAHTLAPERRQALVKLFVGTEERDKSVQPQIKRGGCFWTALQIIVTCIVLFLAALAIQAVVTLEVHGYSIENTASVFWATMIGGVKLDEHGEVVTWDNGTVHRLSYTVCTPTFRAYDDRGVLQPPPIEWDPAQAPALLASERAGCLSRKTPTLTFDGYWGHTPWVVVVSPRSGVSDPRPDQAGDWQAVWVDYTFLGMDLATLKRMGNHDLQTQKPGNATQGPEPATATPAPALPPPAPRPEIGMGEPATPVPLVVPSPASTEPTPSSASTMRAVPTTPPVASPFATQTPRPTLNPTEVACDSLLQHYADTGVSQVSRDEVWVVYLCQYQDEGTACLYLIDYYAGLNPDPATITEAESERLNTCGNWGR